MKKSFAAPPKRAWMFAAAVGAGVAGYLFAVFLPGQRATADLRQQLIEQQNYVLNSSLLDAQIAQAQKDLKRIETFKTTWQSEAASEERLAHIFLKMTQHANESGAVMVLFEPQQPEVMDYLKKVPVQLALEGTYTQIFGFLGRLESVKTQSWIDRLQIELVPATPGKLRCELQVVLFADQPKESD